MCLAVPARVVEVVDEERCRVDLGGIRQEVSTALIDEPRVGEYVIVHVGFALGRIEPEEAEETLRMLASVGVPGAEVPA